MMKEFKYKATVFNHDIFDEYETEGIVFAKSYGNAVNKIVEYYTVISTNHPEYNQEIAKITVEENILPEHTVNGVYEIKDNYDEVKAKNDKEEED